jgi:hypothetical protein
MQSTRRRVASAVFLIMGLTPAVVLMQATPAAAANLVVTNGGDDGVRVSYGRPSRRPTRATSSASPSRR